MKKKSLFAQLLFFSLLFSTTALAHDHAHEHKPIKKEKTMATMKHHQQESSIIIHDLWIRSTPPSIKNTAAYLRIINTTEKNITLIGVSSDSAERVEIHEHIMKNDMMKMQKIDGIIITQQSAMAFEPGGHHIMFFGLKESINVGDEVKITFTFDDDSEQILMATAFKKQGDAKQQSHKDHH